MWLKAGAQILSSLSWTTNAISTEKEIQSSSLVGKSTLQHAPAPSRGPALRDILRADERQPSSTVAETLRFDQCLVVALYNSATSEVFYQDCVENTLPTATQIFLSQTHSESFDMGLSLERISL